MGADELGGERVAERHVLEAEAEHGGRAGSGNGERGRAFSEVDHQILGGGCGSFAGVEDAPLGQSVVGGEAQAGAVSQRASAGLASDTLCVSRIIRAAPPKSDEVVQAPCQCGIFRDCSRLSRTPVQARQSFDGSGVGGPTQKSRLKSAGEPPLLLSWQPWEHLAALD
jgi:hypothetical protein